MIAALVLAAGQSRRMGTQKLLLPFAGQTVIGHVLDQFLQSECNQAFVVVTCSSPLYKVLSKKSVAVVENPYANSDMLGSVRVGLKSLPDNCEAVVITPGDFPFLQSAIINCIVDAFHETNQIIVPVYQEQRGHPLLVPRRYFEEIFSAYDEVGLRGLLHDHSEDIYELKVSQPGVLQDIDVPEDYQKAVEQWSRMK